jgi:hypothetical protein
VWHGPFRTSILGMFDKKAQAEAVILDLESIGNVTDTDIHRVHWGHRKYIFEVRPAGEQPFRIEAKAKMPISSHPEPGDVVKVAHDPKNHKTKILIEGDPRYDPKLIRANKKQELQARTEALLSGAPVPIASAIGHYEEDDEPRWSVPAICPECGAHVDQSRAVDGRASDVRVLRQAAAL